MVAFGIPQEILVVVFAPIVAVICRYAKVPHALHAASIPITVIHRATIIVGGIALHLSVVMQRILIHVLLVPIR